MRDRLAVHCGAVRRVRFGFLARSLELAWEFHTTFGSEDSEMRSEKIRIQCDQCENIVAFVAAHAGTTQECPECGAYLDVPDSSTDVRDPNRQAQKYEEQVAEADRQNEIARRQMEQYQRHLDEWEAIINRKKLEAEQMSAMIARWDGLAERFEKLLARWEKE